MILNGYAWHYSCIPQELFQENLGSHQQQIDDDRQRIEIHPLMPRLKGWLNGLAESSMVYSDKK